MKMKNYQIKNTKGSITIEAIFVFSTVFFIISLLSFIGMIIFEQQRVGNIMKTYVVSASESFKKNDNLSSADIKEFELDIKEKINKGSIIKIKHIEVHLTYTKGFYENIIQASTTVHYKNPFSLSSKIFEDSWLKIEADYEQSNAQNEAVLRDIGLLKDLIHRFNDK